MSCSTKVNLPLISEIKIDKNKLFSNFKDIDNIGNFKMLSCIKRLFNTKNMLKNLSNYMVIILFILDISSILIFRFYDYKKIQESFINIEQKNIKRKMIEKMMTINDEKNQVKNLNDNSKIIRSVFNIKNTNKKKIKKKDKKGIKLKKKSKKRRKITDNSNEILEANIKSINNDEKKFEILTDYELNELNYEEALKKDNRNFIQLYLSLIKIKHPLIFTFFIIKDYNSYIIKIFIFFLTFSMNLTVSAMFYSDSTIHKIYVDYGKFDFIYQLPQMIYSFIISTILENLLSN